LGTEGRLVQLQLREMLLNVREDREAVLNDYVVEPTPERVERARQELIALPSEQLISMSSIGAILGYPPEDSSLETHVHARGYRMLHKIPRLGHEAVASVLACFPTLRTIAEATVAELAAIDGIGPARARDIAEGLSRLREMDIMERYG
jgi:diadenylate cyclase